MAAYPLRNIPFDDSVNVTHLRDALLALRLNILCFGRAPFDLKSQTHYARTIFPQPLDRNINIDTALSPPLSTPY